jgi:hypothetical protein
MPTADVLSALDRDLRAIVGDRLRSLVAYGTGSAGDGPVSTLALVDQLTAADLGACARRVRAWRSFGLATPLILAADEFGRALDAFPFEFGAILADHTRVSGPDPFEGLRVEAMDLRRACEVQARSHLLHLREDYLETEGRSDGVAALVMRSAPALAALLRHVTRLSSALVPAPVLARVAELAPSGTISSDEADRIFPAYLQAMEQLVNGLDRWSGA